MHFADGDIRDLPEKQPHEWIDNVIGAQYLDFPKGSKVQVSIRLKAPPDNASVQVIDTLKEYVHRPVDQVAIVPFTFARELGASVRSVAMPIDPPINPTPIIDTVSRLIFMR